MEAEDNYREKAILLELALDIYQVSRARLYSSLFI